MQVQIKKWGNSAGIPLSKPILQQLKVSQGDSVEMEFRDGGLFLKPMAKPEFTLDELLATCTPEAMQMDDEDREWLHASSVGQELD